MYSFGSYAFSVTTNPGQLSDADFDTKIAVPVLGAVARQDAARLRRLLFESYTLTASELKRKAETNESDAPKSCRSRKSQPDSRHCSRSLRP